MVPIEYFSPIKVMEAIESESCTAVHGVPTMFIAMLEHPEFKRFKFSKLISCGEIVITFKGTSPDDCCQRAADTISYNFV